ncbi:class I SAM-dependent methyltransferase [Pseudoalteromonas luteoviolacea]|uniref:Methyltransferase domain-containing protein n=1 Tax=Pseudoalteromonas luteoviolacea S4054 TaxID=1129367 RepID=A0A0F6A992_9GAMM|nr:class I SAM-dependent methyltransferase [Pseudoalteromonas luteoviolacea]AOT07451.1 hypothetical protein S4054249_06180 [Pseudoalteromonas luteoviolacea]AOT12367.1 hypothetical protein S40542_06180 [Pseudoalteromonas luteoviolacea]AOT17280.1 hypothetical protein S4054_06180 [Pseudoalteromonas luteoviolacea]KKE81964.1 hypothetical protein N479_20315 [Pseudoalteromonas luteoviolacea S4054]KZN74158.1 hypothetical protein N481_09260 [Pseudoalteromonas luteoviolacea S4047-1]
MANWESIYRSGKQLNRYPFSDIVSLVFQLRSKTPDLRVLEVGCGAGNNIYFMASEGVDVAGIDCAPSAIEFAKRRIGKDGLSADLKVGSFVELPWQDNTFDLVIDRSALNCVPRPQVQLALKDIARVLKPGGRIYSQIYSDLHPAHRSAKNTSRNFTTELTYSGFTDIDGLYFASKEDSLQLFSHFEFVDILLSKTENSSGEIIAAQWSITAFKADLDQV